MKFFLLACLLLVQAARAEIPDSFHPIVVKSPFSFSERVFDLTPGFQKAQELKKPVLVYLGASDCPPCKDYTKFLQKHETQMNPVLAKLVVVDIRTWLRGLTPVFQIGDKKYSVKEFMRLVGDDRPTLYYPSWWLFTADAQPLRRLPGDVVNYADVEKHTRLLEGL